MNHHDAEQQPAGGFAPQGSVAYQSPGGASSAPGAPAPQPPRKSWFARHKLLTAILVIVVLVVLASALGGGDEDPATNAGTPAAPAAEAAPPAAEAETEEADEADEPEPAAETAPGIGDAVRDGKFEFTVTEVEAGVAEVGDEWLSEEAQGQFVLVHVTVANIGDQAQMFLGDNQTLVDDQGREHSANTTAAIYLEDSDAFLTDINPGNTVDAVVVFDIPSDAVPATINLHDSMFSGGVTVSLTD